jgi:hypothetical protein
MASQHHTVNAAHGTSLGRELRFRSLSESMQSVAFPCDAAGCVNLDALGERERNVYLFARALMGFQYAFPVIGPIDAARVSAGGSC